MYPLLDLIRTSVSAVFLTLGSLYDLKYREVPDKLWLLYASTGLFLTLTQSISGDSNFLLIAGLSLLVTSALSIVIFYLGLFGGADAKALICLSLTIPTPPTLHRGGDILRLFPITVFNNSVLTAALLTMGFLLYNLLWKLKTGENLFRGLGREPAYKKLITLMTGYKIDVRNLAKKEFTYPLEEAEIDEDGKVVRRLVLSARIEEDEEIERRLNSLRRLNCKVWATPALPFLIFITLGFFLSLLTGDLIYTLIKTIFTSFT
ncbi:prepilin peptidase [Candidatus Bathyarchaeota archaeon]|nr:prepilin peptidase [Candidatus Bathyarchaeota archaeon]